MVPFTLKLFDREKMSIALNIESIREDVLKKYLNERGEGIISMYINRTIADQDYSDNALLKNL